MLICQCVVCGQFLATIAELLSTENIGHKYLYIALYRKKIAVPHSKERSILDSKEIKTVHPKGNQLLKLKIQ